MKALWIESDNQMMPSSSSLWKMPRNQFTISLKEEAASPPSWDSAILRYKTFREEHGAHAHKNADHIAVLSGYQPILNILCTINV